MDLYQHTYTTKFFQEVAMQKLKSIVFVAGVMLLILAAAMGYLSIEELSAMPPADGYKDRGIYTFVPYEVASEQVKNTSASSRERRMNPTKTVPDCGRNT